MRLAATIMLVLFAQSAHADGLGRLFFTAEQRAQLEQRRSVDVASAVPATPRLNGIVQKHGGARTVWINGVAQAVNEEGAADAASVNLPGASRTVRLKVGQSLLPGPATE